MAKKAIPVEEKKVVDKIPSAVSSQMKRTVEKVPLYIGIAAEADKGFKAKLKDLFVSGLDQMAQKFPEHAKMFGKVSKTVLDLIKIGINDKN